MIVVTLISLVIVAFSASALSTHSKPVCWPDGRLIHRDFQEHYQDRITINQVAYVSSEDQVLSPNKGYWFSTIEPERDKIPDNVAKVFVYNERNYLLEIGATDLTGMTEPTWINEKLLLLEFWWGRVLATQLIFDVEAEAVVWKEMYADGWNAYNQTKGACSMDMWKDDDRCKCDLPAS